MIAPSAWGLPGRCILGQVWNLLLGIVQGWDRVSAVCRWGWENRGWMDGWILAPLASAVPRLSQAQHQHKHEGIN